MGIDGPARPLSTCAIFTLVPAVLAGSLRDVAEDSGFDPEGIPMLSSWLVALSVAVSPGQCTTCGPSGGMTGGGMAFSPGMSSGSWTAGMGGFGNLYDAVSMGGGGGGDQLYPFDSPEPWLWGHFQEIPAYGGYASFRPHNYKHVLAQMDVAGRWGISPTMAYSHQWYHRYRQRAGMHPNFGTPYAASAASSYGDVAAVDSPSGADRYFDSRKSGDSLIQAAAMERGYAGTPIPGISVPSYQFSEVPEGRNALGDEYLSRITQMQKHIDRQNYEMQVLRQQMQTSTAGQPAAGISGQASYPNSMALAGQPVVTPNGPAQSGYQELPPPAAYQQYSPAAPQTAIPQVLPQQNFFQPNYQQVAPGLQPGSTPVPSYYQSGQLQQSPQTFVPQQITPQFSQPLNSQSVYEAAPAGAVTAPYGVGQRAPVYSVAPQINGAATGYGTPYQTGQFNQALVPQQPAPQPTLVPMGQPAQTLPQAYGTAPAQTGGFPAPSNGVINAYVPQPGVVSPNAGPAPAYGNGSFVR